MGNRTMNKAQVNKKDEFYTNIHDIEDELRFYRPHFKDKVLYMNTDHPDYSQFWLHFKLLFEVYELKKMISTFWSPEGRAFKSIYDGKEEVRIPLKGDGDFRSDECIYILENEADIVVTNPPFSLFREYVKTLIKSEVKFLILGNNNAITYKEIFPLIRDGKIWLGNKSNTTMKFQVPEDYDTGSKGEVDSNGNKFLKVSAISWFTNMDYPRRYEDLLLWNSYKGSEEFFPYYDNIKAINVGRVRDIPYDYEGVMGVPISFVGHWNPNQFEILGIDDDVEHGHLTHLKPDGWDGSSSRPILNGKGVYRRVLIRNLNPVDEITI